MLVIKWACIVMFHIRNMANFMHISFIMCMYFTIVNCSSLSNPNNGTINCSLGNDGVPSYEDTCSYTCNTGYEITGSDTRTCQSNGSWNGSDDVCRRGTYVHFDSNACCIVDP